MRHVKSPLSFDVMLISLSVIIKTFKSVPFFFFLELFITKVVPDVLPIFNELCVEATKTLLFIIPEA